jgi:hypothetical protein
MLMSNIKNPRRNFLKVGFAGVTTALFSGLFNRTLAKSPFRNGKAVVVQEEEGKQS